MKLRSTLLTTLSLLLAFQLEAQTPADAVRNLNLSTPAKDSAMTKRNMIKLNIPALFVTNFNVQYERILKKKMSLAISVRYMPYAVLPVRSLVQDLLDNSDPNSYKVLDDIKLSNLAITPEVRFYTGKGYGRGLYIAPFYRYVHVSSKKLFSLVYQDSDDVTKSHIVDFTGSMSGHSVGAALGYQWLLGKTFCLDLTIAGPHYGFEFGTLTGTSDEIPSQDEQDYIKEKFDGVKIPLTKQEVTFNGPAAKVDFHGGWGGVRIGLTVGVRF